MIRIAATMTVLALGSFPTVARAEGFSREQAIEAAKQLCASLGSEPDRTEQVIARLEEHIGAILDRHNGATIAGVFAYQLGEGGLIIKVRKGKGLVRWRAQKGDRPIRFKSLGVGAMAGGSMTGATAGDASTHTTELHKKNAIGVTSAHQIVMIGAASGLSADAGAVNLTITPGD